MASRGRPPNLNRLAAIAAGLSKYEANPCWCGCTSRYVKNLGCVECSIAQAKGHYAKVPPDERKARDHALYVRRRDGA